MSVYDSREWRREGVTSEAIVGVVRSARTASRASTAEREEGTTERR